LKARILLQFKGVKILSKDILKAAAIILIAWVMIPGPFSAWGQNQENQPKKDLLSEVRQKEIKALHDHPNGRRPPSMTEDLANKLVEAGFSEADLGQFILLDRLTPAKEQIPLNPDQALILKTAGISIKTIRLILDSIIIKMSAQPAQPHPARPELGQEVIVTPDGKKVIVYHAGRIDQPAREVITLEDGRQIVVYDTGEPKKSGPALDRQQIAELLRAVELIPQLRLHIDRGRLR
ncbi:MAG: hypothetical protein V1742_01300, partial [Pseudomonadota bacterium]